MKANKPAGPSPEALALARYGTTEDFSLAVWMLRDGTMLDGSKEGLQRDYDHQDIAEVYPGTDCEAAMIKFMRRGNVRMGFSESGPCFEFLSPLSDEQLKQLVPWARHCAHNSLEFCAIRHARGNRICEGAWRFLYYISKWMKRNVFDYPESPFQD